jgi:hypothetical protein
MSNLAPAAEIYYSTCGSYNETAALVQLSGVGAQGLPSGTTGCGTTTDIFSDKSGNMNGLLSAIINDLNVGTNTGLVDGVIAANGSAWSVAVKLTAGGYFCVDSTGYAGTDVKGTTTPYTALTDVSPPSTTGAHALSLGSTVCN